jgi:hypothetical protein
MKKLVIAILVIAAAIFALRTFRPDIPIPGFNSNSKLADVAMPATPEEAKSDAYLAKVASAYQPAWPQSIPGALKTEEAQLISITGSDGILLFRYRGMSAAGSDVSSQLVPAVKDVAIRKVCHDSVLTELLKQGVAVRSTFINQNNTNIGSFDVSSTDCSR